MASIAAISAIAAYRAQANEIERLTERHESEDRTRAEERRSADARQLEIDKNSRKASFEDTFFKLLDAFRKIVSEIDIRTSQGDHKSAHDAFERILRSCKNIAISEQWNLRQAWNRTINQYRNDLNHYFRFMYHVVKYVHESDVDNKYFYVRFLRATLSEAEIVLLGLNCEYGDGNEKFKYLVEEYSLLHNISGESRAKWFENTTIGREAFDKNLFST